MRKLILAAALFGIAQGAHAADLPILRGSLPDSYSNQGVNWQGYYIGAQAGYGSADMDFSRANSGQISRLLGDAELRRDLGLAGRRYVETQHRWEVSAARFEALYHEAIAQRRARSGRTSR